MWEIMIIIKSLKEIENKREAGKIDPETHDIIKKAINQRIIIKKYE